MEQKDTNQIQAFDTLFSNNHIQMLKILLPYMDNQTQKQLAVYIKFLELKCAFSFYQKQPFPLCGCMEQETSKHPELIIRKLLPLCTATEKKELEQILSILQSINQYQELQKTMEFMKEFMPEANSENKDPFNCESDMNSILMNLLSPEQQEMFQMFSAMQPTSSTGGAS